MTLAHRERVDNAPFREAVEAAVGRGDSFSQIAQRAGFLKGGSSGDSGDTSYLKRLVGLRPWEPAYPSRDYMSYDAAVKLCRALNLDPHECGL